MWLWATGPPQLFTSLSPALVSRCWDRFTTTRLFDGCFARHVFPAIIIKQLTNQYQWLLTMGYAAVMPHSLHMAAGRESVPTQLDRLLLRFESLEVVKTAY